MKRVDDDGLPYCQFCISEKKVQIKADIILRHKNSGDFITFCNKHYEDWSIPVDCDETVIECIMEE